MRYTEFKTLLEYDRSKTVSATGGGILKAAQRDSFLVSKQLDDTGMIDAVIDEAEAADPTNNKQYVVWVIRQFVKQGLKFEDMYKLKDDLSVFVKTKGQHKRLAINSDINAYNWKTLADTAEKLDSTEIADPESADTAKVEGARILYDGPLGTLSIPETQAASCELGRGTKWCTAADNRNMFDYYNRQGPLYIWHDKKLKEKFQFHFESGQFMDAKDDPIDGDDMHYLTHENSVTKKLFAQKSPLMLDSYIEYIKYEASKEEADYDEYDDFYDGPGEEILDTNLEIALNSISEEQLLKILKAAMYYSDNETDYSNLKNTVIKHVQSNADLLQKARNKVREFETAYKTYMIYTAPVEDAIKFVLNSDSPYQASEAGRVARRLNTRVPELESIIAKDAREAYMYAYHNLGKQRWPKGEAAIATDTWAAQNYATRVLKKRWPEGEAAIKKHPFSWKEYVTDLGIKQ